MDSVAKGPFPAPFCLIIEFPIIIQINIIFLIFIDESSRGNMKSSNGLISKVRLIFRLILSPKRRKCLNWTNYFAK